MITLSSTNPKEWLTKNEAAFPVPQEGVNPTPLSYVKTYISALFFILTKDMFPRFLINTFFKNVINSSILISFS